MAETLLIAYGNPGRQDDGAAYHVILHLREILGLEPVALAEMPDAHLLPNLQVVFTQQLLPELSELLAQVETVVFIDAHIAAAGWLPVDCRSITPSPKSAAGSHRLAPQTLLAWCQELYGRTPRAYILSILGTNFGFGHDISPDTQTRTVTAARLLVEQLGINIATDDAFKGG